MSIISVIAVDVIIGEGIHALFANSSIARPLLPYAGIVVAFRIFIKHHGRFACILIPLALCAGRPLICESSRRSRMTPFSARVIHAESEKREVALAWIAGEYSEHRVRECERVLCCACGDGLFNVSFPEKPKA